MPVVFILLCFSAKSQSSDTIKVNTDSVYSKPDTEAQFRGGEKKWNKYIQTIVEKNIDNLVDDKKSRGTCIIQFIVDTNGIVSALKVTALEESVLAKITSAAILNGPNWIPATANGVNVKSLRILKVTFRVN